MIYLTQLIFIKPGKEAIFHEFEDHAIPLLKNYNGSVLYRVRPDKNAFVSAQDEVPYEIHFIQFQSEADFQAFLGDKERQKFIHLKNESVKTMLLVKGEAL